MRYTVALVGPSELDDFDWVFRTLEKEREKWPPGWALLSYRNQMADILGEWYCEERNLEIRFPEKKELPDYFVLFYEEGNPESEAWASRIWQTGIPFSIAKKEES